MHSESLSNSMHTPARVTELSLQCMLFYGNRCVFSLIIPYVQYINMKYVILSNSLYVVVHSQSHSYHTDISGVGNISIDPSDDV